MNIPFDKIYVLNYVKATERKERLLSNIHNCLGVIDKVDLRICDTLPMCMVEHSKDILHSEYYNKRVHEQNNMYIYNNALSSALNHFFVINSSYELGYENILVLEDDTLFVNDSNLIEYTFNNLPINYGICKYYFQCYNCFGWHSDYSYITNNFFEQNDKIQEYSRVNFTNKQSGANMYSLDRTGMKMLIDKYNEEIHVFDDMLWFFTDKIWFTKYPICYVWDDGKSYVDTKYN